MAFNISNSSETFSCKPKREDIRVHNNSKAEKHQEEVAYVRVSGVDQKERAGESDRSTKT